MKVRSILDENDDWLKNMQNQHIDLVDVENYNAAAVIQENPTVWFYSGVLVTDKPGSLDITHKDEDSPKLITNKREFFFKVIMQILGESFLNRNSRTFHFKQ